jgi:hypothetical protein
LTRLDALFLAALLDKSLGQFRAFAIGDHPAGDGMPIPRLCRLRTSGFLIPDIWGGISRSTHELHSA